MRILVVGASPDLPDLVEQAALAADFGPFDLAPSAVFPEDESALLAHDAVVVEHMAPAIDAVRETLRCRSLTRGEAPVVVVAGDEAIKAGAFRAGAADVVVRPFSSLEFERRVGNVLRQTAYGRVLDERERWIETQIAKTRTELESRQEEIILRLCRAGGYRDHETGEHIIRMARYCEVIAEELGFPSETCRFIYSAAQMHDIGKSVSPTPSCKNPANLPRRSGPSCRSTR